MTTINLEAKARYREHFRWKLDKSEHFFDSQVSMISRNCKRNQLDFCIFFCRISLPPCCSSKQCQDEATKPVSSLFIVLQLLIWASWFFPRYRCVRECIHQLFMRAISKIAFYCDEFHNFPIEVDDVTCDAGNTKKSAIKGSAQKARTRISKRYRRQWLQI